MNKRHKKLLSDLNKIAAHFKLKLSRIEAVKNIAFALDTSRKKLLVIDENDLPYFKTIDLRNVDACTVKFDYSRIDAGDLLEKNMDDFIEKVQLRISHSEPSKSVDIRFYDTKEDHVSELRPLIDKAKEWRDEIAAKLPAKVSVRA
jgi:hypothetical protein